MKGTRHNGRSGKDGVYNPLHNDRRFDPEHSEHKWAVKNGVKEAYKDITGKKPVEDEKNEKELEGLVNDSQDAKI